MIISRESRKSRKIIHRYRSYVAVRMANASEMMRFRVICEIRVRQKAVWNGNIFIMRFPCRMNPKSHLTAMTHLSLRHGTFVSPPRHNRPFAERQLCHGGETGKTHYEIALKRCFNNLYLTGSSPTKNLILTQISRISRRALATLVLAIRMVNTRQSRQLRAFSDAAFVRFARSAWDKILIIWKKQVVMINEIIMRFPCLIKIWERQQITE